MANTNTYRTNPENRWFLRWRHIAAYVFLLTILFDFIVMPTIYELNNKVNMSDAVTLSLKFKNPASQTAVVQLLLDKKVWDPITLKGNGIFFICFGAILGVASWTRGTERIINARNNLQNSDNSGEDTDIDNPDKAIRK